MVNIFEKILDFNKQKKGEGLLLDLAYIAKASNRKVNDRTHIKTLTPKQTFQRLPIALAQVKANNTSENFLNESRQIIYSLCTSKEIINEIRNIRNLQYIEFNEVIKQNGYLFMN